MTAANRILRTVMLACLTLTSMVLPGMAQQPPADVPVEFAFVAIQPGTFMMGCVPEDPRCDPDESPRHQVTLTRPYEIGVYPVTQAQWSAIMGTDPSAFKGADHPVESVNWNDVQQFLTRINARNDGYRYRLPTEAEWEYAARAGEPGMNLGPIDEYAWYLENSGGSTHPVGQKRPNAWGMYDVQGNVYEFTSDWYGDYSEESQTDPTGFEDGSHKVPRGGAWESTPIGIRLSNRNFIMTQPRSNLVGFRLVREPAR